MNARRRAAFTGRGACERSLEAHETPDQRVVAGMRSVALGLGEQGVEPVLGFRNGERRYLDPERAQAGCAHRDQKRWRRADAMRQVVEPMSYELGPRKSFEATMRSADRDPISPISKANRPPERRPPPLTGEEAVSSTRTSERSKPGQRSEPRPNECDAISATAGRRIAGWTIRPLTPPGLIGVRPQVTQPERRVTKSGRSTRLCREPR